MQTADGSRRWLGQGRRRTPFCPEAPRRGSDRRRQSNMHRARAWHHDARLAVPGSDTQSVRARPQSRRLQWRRYWGAIAANSRPPAWAARHLRSIRTPAAHTTAWLGIRGHAGGWRAALVSSRCRALRDIGGPIDAHRRRRPRDRARRIVGCDLGHDPQTAASIGHIPKQLHDRDFLEPRRSRGARIGLLTHPLFGRTLPMPRSRRSRAALREMTGAGCGGRSRDNPRLNGNDAGSHERLPDPHARLQARLQLPTRRPSDRAWFGRSRSVASGKY